MARPKKFKNPVTCSFKLEAETLRLLKDFAAACGQSTSDLLSEFVTGLVEANSDTIKSYRLLQTRAIKPTFAEPTPPNPARTSKKKPAQVADEVKGGENVAQDD